MRCMPHVFCGDEGFAYIEESPLKLLVKMCTGPGTQVTGNPAGLIGS